MIIDLVCEARIARAISPRHGADIHGFAVGEDNPLPGNQQNQNTGTVYAPNAQSMMSSALGQQLGQATVQMITKNMNIAPTLEIRPGYRFNILVTKDLTLSKPYEAFDY